MLNSSSESSKFFEISERFFKLLKIKSESFLDVHFPTFCWHDTIKFDLLLISKWDTMSISILDEMKWNFILSFITWLKIQSIIIHTCKIVYQWVRFFFLRQSVPFNPCTGLDIISTGCAKIEPLKISTEQIWISKNPKTHVFIGKYFLLGFNFFFLTLLKALILLYCDQLASLYCKVSK